MNFLKSILLIIFHIFSHRFNRKLAKFYLVSLQHASKASFHCVICSPINVIFCQRLCVEFYFCFTIRGAKFAFSTPSNSSCQHFGVVYFQTIICVCTVIDSSHDFVCIHIIFVLWTKLLY